MWRKNGTLTIVYWVIRNLKLTELKSCNWKWKWIELMSHDGCAGDSGSFFFAQFHLKSFNWLECNLIRREWLRFVWNNYYYSCDFAFYICYKNLTLRISCVFLDAKVICGNCKWLNSISSYNVACIFYVN